MISVIIPIYNTGDYLRDCIQSVCNQTYADLQIIMIDDGSEEYTAKICDDLADDDSRIEIVHKENEGVSRARNVGLERAKGDIVCFVDSDDTIHPNMFGTFISALNSHSADIAMCDATTIIPGRPSDLDTIPDFKESCLIDIHTISPATLTRLAGSAWRCGYRTDTLVKARARFPEGIKFSEDRIFNLMAMGAANKISYIKEPLYNRLIRSGSACFRFYPDIVEQIVIWRKVLLKTIEDYWGNYYIAAFERQVSGHILFSITNFTAPYSRMTIKEQLAAIKELCSNEDVQVSLKVAGTDDLRSRFIQKQYCCLLFIIGHITNFIHRLCKKGQYQL